MRPMSFGQGGPEWGPGGTSTPDWAALAEEAEQKRGRRKRWLLIGGGALATAAVAGIVAVAVVSESGGGSASDNPSESLPAPEDLPSNSPGQPGPSFEDDAPPPPPPEDFIADRQHDKAPLSAGSLFPESKAAVNGREYARKATATSKKCTSAAHAELGPVLSKHDCERMFRATFTKNGLAVTVGVAVFEDARTAAAVKKQYKPNVVALPGKGVPDFCRTVGCRTTADSLGRYAFFTISGHTDGKEAGPSDKAAIRTSLDASKYTYQRVLQHGQAQAAAAATSSPSS